MALYVPCHYLPSEDHALRQAEILEGIHELKFDLLDLSPASFESSNPPSLRTRHSWTIVLSPACDLEWDYNAREQGGQEGKLVSHLLLCDLEDEAGIRDNIRIHNNGELDRARS